MGETIISGDKASFADDRTPARHLGVSSHPEAGVVVLSLWEGERCRATFRLRISDAPALITVLADAFGASIDAGPPQPAAPPDPSPAPSTETAALCRIK